MSFIQINIVLRKCILLEVWHLRNRHFNDSIIFKKNRYLKKKQANMSVVVRRR